MVLCRISDDKAEDASGVGRQEEDCRALADRMRWGVGEVVVENDISAFKRRRVRLPDGTAALRVVRPGFRRVLDLLASGEADGLIAWDLDRVARDPRDLEDLIDVIEQHNRPVESVTGSLRLGNDADITMARVMVAVANKSSRDTSRRVARKHQQLAAEGKPGGGGIRPYGYETDRMTVRAAEAEVIREIARRILAGDSLYVIAADLTVRGVPTVVGGPWNTRSVRSVVTKPRVAALRSVGSGAARRIVGDALWPAILDRETWEQVCAAVAGRATRASGELQRWLNGLLFCSLCGMALVGAIGNNGPRYWCATPKGGCGKISVIAAGAEAEVERQITEYLGEPQVLTRLRSLSSGAASAEARAELAADESQLKEMAAAYARRHITFGEYMEARRIVEARVKDARALLKAAAPRVLRGLLAGDVGEKWSSLAPADKREAALAVLPDGYEVAPFDKSKGRRFDPSRLLPRVPEA